MFHLATPRLLFFVLDNQRVEADTECVIANHQIVCQPQPSTAKGVRIKKKGTQEEGHRINNFTALQEGVARV